MSKDDSVKPVEQQPNKEGDGIQVVYGDKSPGQVIFESSDMKDYHPDWTWDGLREEVKLDFEAHAIYDRTPGDVKPWGILDDVCKSYWLMRARSVMNPALKASELKESKTAGEALHAMEAQESGFNNWDVYTRSTREIYEKRAQAVIDWHKARTRTPGQILERKAFAALAKGEN